MSAKALKHVHGTVVNRQGRTDAAETIFFDRELEHAKKKVHERTYPDLVGKQLIPSSPDPVPPGVKTYRWLRRSENGIWAVIHGAAQNIPRVDVKMFEETGKCRTIADAFGYDVQDITDSRITGKPLSAMRAMAARKILEEGMDECLYFGLLAHGITGFCNDTNVTDVAVSARGGATTWAAKVAIDPDYIVQDVLSVYNGIRLLTNYTENPNTFALPPSRMAILTQNNLSKDNSKSILSHLKEKIPGMVFLESPRLETASDASGALGVMYVRDQDHLYYEEPKGFEMSPAFQKSIFEWEVACTAEVGGTVWVAPLSAAYVTAF